MGLVKSHSHVDFVLAEGQLRWMWRRPQIQGSKRHRRVEWISVNEVTCKRKRWSLCDWEEKDKTGSRLSKCLFHSDSAGRVWVWWILQGYHDWILSQLVLFRDTDVIKGLVVGAGEEVSLSLWTQWTGGRQWGWAPGLRRGRFDHIITPAQPRSLHPKFPWWSYHFPHGFRVFLC